MLLCVVTPASAGRYVARVSHRVLQTVSFGGLKPTLHYYITMLPLPIIRILGNAVKIYF